MINSIFDSILLNPRFNSKYYIIQRKFCWFNSKDHHRQKDISIVHFSSPPHKNSSPHIVNKRFALNTRSSIGILETLSIHTEWGRRYLKGILQSVCVMCIEAARFLKVNQRKPSSCRTIAPLKSSSAIAHSSCWVFVIVLGNTRNRHLTSGLSPKLMLSWCKSLSQVVGPAILPENIAQ